MNPHDRQPPPVEADPIDAVMWTLTKGPRVARCELWRHPLGWESRCDVDGALVQTAVQRRRETAEDQAADWRERFVEKGWR